MMDDLVIAPPKQDDIVRWLASAMSGRRQLIVPLFGVIAGPIFLYLIRTQLEHVVAVTPPSYLMVSWTSFIGGNVAYWLWTAPGIGKRLYKCHPLKLRWQDPAATPGLRLLVDGLALSAMFLMAGVVSISGLGFWLPSILVVPAARYLLYVFFFVAVCTSLRVAVVPFLWSWAIIVRQKRLTMATLDNRLPSLTDAVRTDGEQVEKWALVYQTVAAAPNLPFSTAIVVQYSTAFVGSIFAFVIGLLTHK
jgi:hypothetical protein